MAKTKKNLRENLKELNVSELIKKLASLKEEIRVIRFKAEGSKSKNVKETSTIKKQIAQILTEINSNKK
jgi:ribosomal protein L29